MSENTRSKWVIDSGHSTLNFKVKHLAVSNVAGVFRKFAGEADTINDDFSNAKVQCVIDVDSIDTNHEQRNNDLLTPLFFDAAQFPEIRFDGTLIKKGEDYELSGTVTMRDITRPIVMAAELTGIGKGRFNDTRAGFELTGKINRKDFGMSFGMLTEAGGLVVGEEIKLHFDVQLIKQ